MIEQLGTKFMSLLQQFSDSVSVQMVILTVLLFFSVQGVRYLAVKWISKSNSMNGIDKVIYQKNLGTYANVLFVFLLIVLWFSQIQAVLVSLFAVAAALVLATKELIMSVTGGILIRVSGSFRIGDRIEVDGIRGFVIEKSLMVTKVLEIGPEKFSQQTTGDMIAIPNSIMLSKTVKNESYFRDYSIKSFVFPLPENISLSRFEENLLLWGEEVCKDHLADARRTIGDFCRKEGLLIPIIEPRSKVIVGDEGKISMMLKIPVLNRSIGDIEQALNRQYVSLVQKVAAQK